MTHDLSILLVLRDIEPAVAGMVRDAQEIGASLANGGGFEILALDERSGDNTLAVLSILHARVPELRTLQDLSRGSGVMQGTRVARGRRWLIVDHPVSAELMRWAVVQLRDHGHPAAIVPGEVLAVEAGVGAAHLYELRGGLVSAQRAIERGLGRESRRAAWRPAPSRGCAERALHFVRRRLSGISLNLRERRSDRSR
ncbi:MAG: hypothetical protein KC486_14815 [Myxococcales bacterium]|nr:hypothetical protein [Myxococcales bacterium]